MDFLDLIITIAILCAGGLLTGKKGKAVETSFIESFFYPKFGPGHMWQSVADIVKEKGLMQISDESAIKEVVDRIVAANPQSVEDYKAGKDRALGFLVGQCMKELKGKGNPQIINKLVLEHLQ